MMWNGHKTSVRLMRIITSSVLILSILVSWSLREYGPVVAHAAEEARTTYVSDVRLFYALDSLEAAKNKCIESGFTPVEGDLNEGTGKNHVVMGYKETDNKEDAITSIKLLSMNSGYQLKDYAALQKEYESSNAAIIDTIEAASQEFVSNYKAGSPKAKEAYEGLNLIEVPEANNMKLGDYIVSGKADWNFYAKVVTRASSGTTSAIIGYLSAGLATYKNEYDAKKREVVTMSWAEKVKDSPVWEDLEDATTEDDYDELFREYGDDAKAFHKKLQEFATGYDNAMASFDEGQYTDELEKLKGKTDEQVLDNQEKLDKNEQGLVYLGIYEELDKYQATEDDTLAEYLLEIGYKTSGDVDLTKLYPILDSMTYAQRRMACLGGLNSIISNAGENEASEEAEEKISEAAENIKKLVGRESYSVWMNNNEEIKDKKVAYTSDAVRKNAAQQLLDDYDNSTLGEKVEDIMKWVNLALGIVSCLLIILQFTWVTYVFAAIPAAICAIAAACGLTCCATTIGAIAGKIGALSSASGPVGWIILAILIISLIVVWVIKEIEKYIKENKDYDYNDAPAYAADCAEGEHGEYLTYYKGVGSENSPSEKYRGKTGSESEDKMENYHGEAGISDVNGRMGFRGWNLMFYSKDTNVGTPLVIKDGKSPFLIKYGDGGNMIKGYESVNAFGEITPGNCNALMKKDEKGGVFVHYRTEKSVLNDQDSSGGEAGTVEGDGKNTKKTYYSDIIIKSADTEERAKAKITVKKGFKVWDYNLANNARKDYSRHEEWAYTYLGFKTTTDPKKAIKDIRVATFTPETKQEVVFGEVTYACAGNLGYKADSKTEDKEYPEDLDGLWFTTNEKAGTPIEFGGLHLVDSHKDGEYVNNGWIPVTTFSGVPYNFASTRDSDTDDWEAGRLGNAGYRYTCYQTSKDNSWECPARYLYYEPEVKYTSGKKYLSAVFFTFGTDSESTGAKVGEVLAKYSDLTDRMKKTPNTVIRGGNLASSFNYKGYVVESNQKYLNIGYSWSYNPYRAITDVKAFQGTIFSSELPYTISKPIATSDSNKTVNVGYGAATVISQRTTTKCSWVTRGIGPENAYMAPNGLLGTNKQVPQGYTSYRPGGYAYSQEKMPFIATGLYVCGPTESMEKITLDDVIITGNSHVAENKKGIISTGISGEKTLSDIDATGDFNSIQEMKRPFETEPFNIAYPEWTNDDNDHYDAASPCYIYLRRPALKKKYISKVFVGTYAFKNSEAEEDYDTNQAIAKMVDTNALVDATRQTVDEVIPANVALTPGRTWYGTTVKGVDEFNGRKYIDSTGGWYEKKLYNNVDIKRLPWGPPHYDLKEDGNHRSGKYSADYVDRPASYIGVERTDDPDEAVKGLILYKSKEKNVPQRIQVDGADYYCASPSTPIEMRGMDCKDDDYRLSFKWTEEKYYLYYTTNQGVSPGHPITEITVDDNVFNSKQATCLCVDKLDKTETSKDGRKSIKERAKPYGESKMPMFIHASFEKDDNAYFNKIYTANGKTKKEALLQLLEQGCTEFLDMNLNEGASLTDKDTMFDSKKKGGDYIYFGYRGYTLKDDTGESKEEQLKEAVYDIVCTVGEPYHPEGIQTERYNMYYMPVVKLTKDDDMSGTDLNAGTNGPPIYMYYTTTDAVNDFNKKTGSDARKNLSPKPKDYFKSPLTSLCFTRYDRVPYNSESGAAGNFGENKKAWEYVLYSDSSTPVDFNDGTVKLNSDFLTENNHISMFAQREDGSVKKSAEITGGYISSKAEVGEMWLNR
ncbi:hypothetical protein [Eubacterium xylanophilum]|uniref:hypothetical protein n=1 Tax=Eubacterium xylanophilum TaxID=39497 RepID=UPI00047CDEF5|nr:hypothetical protein [Eubacterium xylanophilum]